MKRVVIMQPSYLPWLGYFDLIEQADLFLVYDNVQYDKDGWRNRNRIKTSNGPQWLTVPVLTKGQNKPTNRDVLINPNERWQRKHLGSLEMNYRQAPFFEEVYSLVQDVLEKPFEKLMDLNMAFIDKFCEYLQVQSKIEYVSNLDLDLPEDKNQKLIEILKKVEATEFYEPQGGAGYIDSEIFKQNDIQLVFQDYQHPEYPQLHGAFEEKLSVVDLLFNCGSKSRDYLLKGSLK